MQGADFLWINRAQARKVASSIGSTLYVLASKSSQPSISADFFMPCSRVNSIPACISPGVTTDRDCLLSNAPLRVRLSTRSEHVPALPGRPPALTATAMLMLFEFANCSGMMTIAPWNP